MTRSRRQFTHAAVTLLRRPEKLGIAKSTLYQKIKEYGLAQEVTNARVGRPTETARLS